MEIMLSEDLKKKIKEVVESKGYELFSIEWRGSNKKGLLIVTIDCLGGITLKDCEEVSKALNVFLDLENPFPFSYRLEVSSPGIERPLRNLQDFKRFKGKPLSFFYKGIKYKGIIIDVLEESILIKIKNNVENFKFEEIEKSHLLGPWEEI